FLKGLLIANVKLATATPFGVYLKSASLVILPTILTLFIMINTLLFILYSSRTIFATVFPHNFYYNQDINEYVFRGIFFTRYFINFTSNIFPFFFPFRLFVRFYFFNNIRYNRFINFIYNPLLIRHLIIMLEINC